MPQDQPVVIINRKILSFTNRAVHRSSLGKAEWSSCEEAGVAVQLKLVSAHELVHLFNGGAAVATWSATRHVKRTVRPL